MPPANGFVEESSERHFQIPYALTGTKVSDSFLLLSADYRPAIILIGYHSIPTVEGDCQTQILTRSVHQTSNTKHQNQTSNAGGHAHLIPRLCIQQPCFELNEYNS